MPFDSRSVQEQWDLAADAYAQRDRPPASTTTATSSSGRRTRRICGDVRGLRLLDVGCGSGYFAREMMPRGARVTGIDISPRMIASANEHETASPLGIAYQAVDAADLSSAFERGVVRHGHVVSGASGHAGSGDGCCAAFSGALRPGGRFCRLDRTSLHEPAVPRVGARRAQAQALALHRSVFRARPRETSGAGGRAPSRPPPTTRRSRIGPAGSSTPGTRSGPCASLGRRSQRSARSRHWPTRRACHTF